MIFFEGGRLGQLGGYPGKLKIVMQWLQLEFECASNLRLDYHEQRQQEARAKGLTNLAFDISYVANEYKMSRDYVEELQQRDYLYRDELGPRLQLASHSGSSLMQECLPGVVRQVNNSAYEALEGLLRALPGKVYLGNLQEFMLEYHEANGRMDIRRRWADRSGAR
jgi:hypothetical protein